MDDRRKTVWADVAVTVITAWMLLTSDQQRRILAAGIRGTAALCRQLAERAGRAAIACEHAYTEVLRP